MKAKKVPSLFTQVWSSVFLFAIEGILVDRDIYTKIELILLQWV